VLIQSKGLVRLASMKVILEIPDEFVDELSLRMGNPARAALEALASRAYEKGIFSLEQVRRLLSQGSRWEAQQVLTASGVWPGTTVHDFESDMAVLKALRKPEGY
jgi:hypothetical protein